jgi:hypothetical protein
MLSSTLTKHPPRKGLGKGGVCLLQHYCPMCFKGRIGVACGLYVAKDSTLIDQVQVLHSAKGNGLPPIDFMSPGEYCANTELCKMICLVCGKTMVDGEDEEFETFLTFFDDEESHPVTLKYEVNEAMDDRKLVWVNQPGSPWKNPIHKHCSKMMGCKCVVPKGTAECTVHNLKRVLGQRLTLEAPKPSPPIKTMATPCKAPSIKGDQTTPNVPTAGKGSVLTKASWLPPQSAIATVVTPLHLDYPAASKSTKKITPSQAKPTLRTERLKEAASACAFKITQWTDTHPTNIKLDADQERDATVDHGKQRSKFSLADHNENFDVLTDGAWLIQGESWYKPHNAPMVRTPVGVNTLNEDGTMTPLVPA